MMYYHWYSNRLLVRFDWLASAEPVTGLFVCERRQLLEALGRDIYVADKHIYGTITDRDFTILCEDQDCVTILAGCRTIEGLNPLELVR